MSKTVELRQLFNRIFEGHSISAYYGVADDESLFPYAVWELREISSENNRSTFVLEINGYSIGSDTTALEDMLDVLEGIFNYTRYDDSNFVIACYKYGNRLDIHEPDKKIKRKRIQFQIQYAERSTI